MCLICLFYTEKDVMLPNCIITPINPAVLAVDGGINNGTSNVMMKCNCLSTNYQDIRWYSPNKEEITLHYAEDTPYLIQESGTLVFPIFNDTYQGTYYCGVGNDSMFAANVSLNVWTGMF